MSTAVAEFMSDVAARNPGQPEFIQAVHEVVESVWPVVESTPAYQRARILDRMIEPERVITFRVSWLDDRGEVQVNRGFRVQTNSAIGPYKGGLRFHSSVNLSILKFLGFEQTFKNALTTLPMGGGKGGSDFNPRGRSDTDVMRFCQAFMTELFRHIGPETDVPAGDLGVGGREIGYLFGQYKKLTNRFHGVLTGKGLGWGGSLVRPEATGYGVVYFAEEVLNRVGDSIEGKTCLVSGAGNVGLHTIEKINALGGKVVTMTDFDGTVVDPDGINPEKLAFTKQLVTIERGSLQRYVDHYPSARWMPGEMPWGVPCDVAFPTACENELKAEDARTLVAQGCKAVIEGANMPCTPEAVETFIDHQLLFAPGKASNAGGVATSGLEMSQNAMHLSWPAEEVDTRLRHIMQSIHATCVEHGTQGDFVNYVDGANISGFIKVADAMIDQGVV